MEKGSEFRISVGQFRLKHLSGCFQFAFEIFTCSMDIHNMTINQLKRAVAIKEQIEGLSKELRTIFAAPSESGDAPKKNRTMSASAKKKISATQKARWASVRRASSTTPSRSASDRKKRTMSRAARAKLSARMKAHWAARRAGKK